MPGAADKIVSRVRSRGGRWVCTPKDFLDLGSRPAVDSGLVAPGQIRPVTPGGPRPVRCSPDTAHLLDGSAGAGRYRVMGEWRFSQERVKWFHSSAISWKAMWLEEGPRNMCNTEPGMRCCTSRP